MFLLLHRVKYQKGYRWVPIRGRPIYRADILKFFYIYRHRPISVFSSADLESGTSAGSPVLLVRWNVLLQHVKDPNPKLLEDSTTVLRDKGKA